MSQNILLIRTGGTIEAQSYDDPEKPPEDIIALKGNDSPIFSVVQNLPENEKLDIHMWSEDEEERFVKDSKFFTAEEIKELADIIRNNEQYAHFMVTHGTDAMMENADLLDKELLDSGKTVFFVGSVVPLSMRGTYKCTGVEALRYSLKNIGECSSGVYVVGTDIKNAQWGVFKPAGFYKDKEISLKRATLTLVSS